MNKKMSKGENYTRGKIWDIFTYAGILRTLAGIIVFWAFGWNIDELFMRAYCFFNKELVVDPADIAWHKFVISMMCGMAGSIIFAQLIIVYIKRKNPAVTTDTLWDEWELHQQWKQRQQAEAKRWKKRIKIELHEPEEEPAPPAVPAEPVDVPISSEHEIRLPGMDEGVMRETGALPMRLEVPAGQDATASPKLVGHYHSGTNRIVLVRKHQGRASSKGWHRGGQCRGAGKSPAAAGRKKGPRGVRAKRNTTDRSRSYCRKKGKELSWPGRRCRPWRSGHPDWT
ncbi:hypothetical protein [Microvirgula aerodenitrificans]|uniref:hypothetical protein n=1 Tax=Microvirgula aerodenitrificans TaxID=57480 RepID=UPI00248DEB54|nr:hypothetical protein [Microvirgula aerodenitrificans]